MTAEKFHLSSLKASRQYAPNFVKFILNEYLTSFWFVFNKLLAGFIQLLRIKSELQHHFFLVEDIVQIISLKENEIIKKNPRKLSTYFYKTWKIHLFLGGKAMKNSEIYAKEFL